MEEANETTLNVLKDMHTEEDEPGILDYYATRIEDAIARERAVIADMCEAVLALYKSGILPDKSPVICPLTIYGDGYNPKSEFCAECNSGSKNKCIALYEFSKATANLIKLKGESHGD